MMNSNTGARRPQPLSHRQDLLALRKGRAQVVCLAATALLCAPYSRAAPLNESPHQGMLDEDASPPNLPGPDFEGEAGVVVVLGRGAPRVELEDQLYTLEFRPLELAFGDLDTLNLLFEVPQGAQLRVRKGAVVELWESTQGHVDYPLEHAQAGTSLVFEVVELEETDGQPIEVVILPIPDKPEPD